LTPGGLEVNSKLQPLGVWDAQCVLGEGCVWLESEQALYFVDIKGQAIHAWTPATAQQRSWPVPEKIGWLVPRRSGGWVAGLQSGVAALTLNAQGANPPDIQWLHRLHEADSPMRLNDAKADAQGRLWFGSMHNVDDTQALGKFYRLDPDNHLSVVDEGYGVTNGPTFSLDGKTLWHTDSAAQKIYAFDVNADGSLSGKRLWLQFSTDDGYPDGMTTDALGQLWIAHWSAAQVTCHDPLSARVLQTITFDAPLITNVCFGGEALQDLYITSARVGLSPEVLAQHPLSGALFMVKSVGQGLPANYFSA
jgi:xylono-1,5-lactonase